MGIVVHSRKGWEVCKQTASNVFFPPLPRNGAINSSSFVAAQNSRRGRGIPTALHSAVMAIIPQNRMCHHPQFMTPQSWKSSPSGSPKKRGYKPDQSCRCLEPRAGAWYHNRSANDAHDHPRESPRHRMCHPSPETPQIWTISPSGSPKKWR